MNFTNNITSAINQGALQTFSKQTVQGQSPLYGLVIAIFCGIAAAFAFATNNKPKNVQVQDEGSSSEVPKVFTETVCSESSSPVAPVLENPSGNSTPEESVVDASFLEVTENEVVSKIETRPCASVEETSPPPPVDSPKSEKVPSVGNRPPPPAKAPGKPKELQSSEERAHTESVSVKDWWKTNAKNLNSPDAVLSRIALYHTLQQGDLKKSLENSVLGSKAKVERSNGSSKLKLVQCDPIVYKSVELLNNLRKNETIRPRFFGKIHSALSEDVKSSARKLLDGSAPSNKVSISQFMGFMSVVLLAQGNEMKQGRELFSEFGITDSHEKTQSMKIE